MLYSFIKHGEEYLIKMSLYELPNATSSLDNMLVQAIAASPSFTPLLLVFAFFVVFLGGSGRQLARNGTADYSMWCVIASLSIFMISLIMSTITGIIRLDWLVIVVVVTIFSGVWFFLDRKPSEI